MDGAFGRDLDLREPADQALTDLTSTPAGVLALHVQDIVLHLKGQLMGIAIRTSASVRQPLNSALLVAIEDLVAGLAGNAELPAEFRHKFKSFVHHRTLLPRHPLPPQKGKKCNLCIRYDLLPMCRVAHHSGSSDICKGFPPFAHESPRHRIVIDHYVTLRQRVTSVATSVADPASRATKLETGGPQTLSR